MDDGFSLLEGMNDPDGLLPEDPGELRPEEKKSAEPEKTADVRIIRTEKKMALVEYTDQHDGRLKRVSVEAKKIQNGAVSVKDLKKGIAYGLDFDELEIPVLTSVQLADILHNHGLWTAEDVRQNRPALIASALEAQGQIVKMVLNFIKGK